MDKIQTKIAKWSSETIYVDIETGLLISKRLAKRDYIIIRTIKKNEIYGSHGIIKRTNECRKNRQLQLF